MISAARPVAVLALVAASLSAPVPAARAAVPAGGAVTVLGAMTQAQRIGQLFMVGTPATAASPATLTAITDLHVGNVILTGRSSAGTAGTATVVATLKSRASAAATGGVPLFVATDQEGGAVQVLHGSGFSAMPSALTQGSWTTTKLRASAAAWGRQLRAAGVNLNLGPVADTVPSRAAAAKNPPIGVYHREFGYTTGTVASHAVAFAAGMADAGIDTAVKHFPGLGRVIANPDVATSVTDTVTTRTSASIAPFARSVSSGVPFLMMSTAYYSRIDPAQPAAFSSTIIRGMVRGDLGFTGVVISDDLGNARQVAHWSPGARAVQFLQAGGDMVLTVNPALVPAMIAAVRVRVSEDPVFRSQVNASALRILKAKEARGLIGHAGRGATTQTSYDGLPPARLTSVKTAALR